MSCEVSWFAALCDDDYEFLGVPDGRLQSSWEHCRDIALGAEQAGYDNLLLPSGYAPGPRPHPGSSCGCQVVARLIVTHDLHWEDNVRLGPQEWYE